MTDRDLMVAVAKAIGGTLSEGHTQRRSLSTAGGWEWIGAPGVVTPDDWVPYPGVVIHPLHDDGDALRLAVKLDCLPIIEEWSDGRWVFAPRYPECAEPLGADPCAATRRAIVNAVAAAAFPIPSQEVQP